MADRKRSGRGRGAMETAPVLIVEDNPTTRAMMRRALEGEGYSVQEAEDGMTALLLVATQEPGMVLLDCKLPDMDGFEVGRRLRALVPNLPIVAVTGRAHADEARVLTAGFLDVLVKPVEPSRLVEVADRFSRELDPESALNDTLSICLDATGLSEGAIFLAGPSGKLTLKAHVGSAAKRSWEPFAEVLRQAMVRGPLLMPSAKTGPEGHDLLAGLGMASALIVPIAARGEALGALLLASNRIDLADPESSDAFMRAARSVSKQLGDALALSQTFAKLVASEKRLRTLTEGAGDEALRLREAPLTRLAESGIVGIAVADVTGKLLEANDAYLEMLGYSREELLTGELAWSKLTPQEAPSAEEIATAEAPSIGAARLREAELRRKDGTRVPVLIGVAMLDYPKCIAVVSDLTDRKRAERALRAREEQLRQAQKMEAVGLLAGGVAHDFNNILSVILSYAEMIISDLKPGDPLREDMDEIRKAGQRAADLTRQLLTFSRQNVIAPRVLDLNEVLSGMDKMLKGILGDDVDMIASMTRPLGKICVDPSGIEQVILNLVVNARDAMPTGGKLTLETGNVMIDDAYAREHTGVTPGPYVMLAVSDTGIGMDKATQARIFEPFFTTKSKEKGTGLGLATVFGIAQQSRGSVWVYSEPGRGTTFKVYLPLAESEVERRPISRPPVTLRGTETVLLVEDEDSVRAVALGILQRQGYHVMAARRAREALLLCEHYAGAIDVLLTDVVMPEMSGPELARRLAKDRPGIRIICMSGYTDDSAVRHGVLEGKVAYIQKPITTDVLARKVREVLDEPHLATVFGVSAGTLAMEV